jgi:hypothetical protein
MFLNRRLLGIPIQFIGVFLISFMLCVYLAAAAAANAGERRAEAGGGDEYAWEKTALWVCPLH